MGSGSLNFFFSIELYPPEERGDIESTHSIWSTSPLLQEGGMTDIINPYHGFIYVCIQAHTVYDPNWTPPNTPAFRTLDIHRFVIAGL